MIDKPVKIGFDRFIALEWANYSLELFLNSQNEVENYQLLKHYLQHETPGLESARKTSNQLKRLWLNQQDDYRSLRTYAGDILVNKGVTEQSLFHLGMAINVFPIFKETCKRIGELAAVQSKLNTKIIGDRVSQIYLNPSSVPRIVSRVIQTLEDWGFVETYHENMRLVTITIDDIDIGAWILSALIYSRQNMEISLSSINNMPEMLGLRYSDPRQIVHQSSFFSTHRNGSGEEMAVLTK